LSKKNLQIGGRSNVVWTGRPSVSVFYALYGLISLFIAVVIIGLELWLGSNSSIGLQFFPQNLSMGGVVIPYPVELATGTIIFLAYLGEAIHLALLRARHKYVLREDGLYVDSGIFNLQNTFLAPMAFSDARLELPVSLRILHRGNIIVDANDNRHFKLLLLQDPVTVQTLLRRTLGHPIVRVESPSSP
jgi:hypothetical protein